MMLMLYFDPKHLHKQHPVSAFFNIIENIFLIINFEKDHIFLKNFRMIKFTKIGVVAKGGYHGIVRIVVTMDTQSPLEQCT